MSFDITTAILSDGEAELLYQRRPELRAGPDDYCPTCAKTGTYRWQGVEHTCDCARQLQLAKHYSAAGIGVGYQRLDWGDFDGDEVLLTQVLKYLENHQRYIDRGIGLLFHGRIGTGKTLVATLIIKELIKRGYSCFVTTFAETIESFTASWGSRESKDRFAEKFMGSQVLLLDDLGRELRTGSNLPQSTFDMILRRRVSENRPTIVTTNSTPAELGTGYGAQVLSLLMEQSIAHEFTGEDFRPRANLRTRTELDADETRPIT